MADNFNLINFKRGSLADLQALNTAANRDKIEIGTFYLTIDEGASAPESARLFIGREVDGTKKVVPVNQGIIKVDNVQALEQNSVAGNFQPGDFAYVENGNILAIRSNNSWIQINSQAADVYLSSLALGVNDNNGSGTATVTTTGTMANSGSHPQDAFTITGAGTAHVSGNGKAVTITGDEYTLAAGAVAGNAVTVGLNSTGHSNNNGGSFGLTGAGSITLSKDGDNIVITGSDAKAQTVTGSAETQGFGIVVGNSDTSSSQKGTIDPIITLGTHTGTGDQIHFANGIANLPVYTKAEVDTIKNTMNAMVYRGTLGGQDADFVSTAAITNPAVGDTFRVLTQQTGLPIKDGNTIENEGIAKPGDLVILLGTEENGVITSGLYYDIIPAGDEFDTQYAVLSKTKGIGIQQKASGGNSEIGSIVLVDGNKISVSESGTTAKELTINHNTATVTTAAETTNPTIVQTDGASQDFVVVTSIEDDGYGHLSSVNTRTITVKDTNANLTSVVDTTAAGTGNAAGKEATITTTVNMQKSNLSTMTKAGSFKIESDNLQVSVPADGEVKLNLVWGSF